MKYDITKVKFVHIVSGFILLMGFLYFFLYSFTLSTAQKQDSKEVLISVIGLLGTVAGFWVGSSNSSSKKDEVIKQAITNSNNQAPQVKADNIENLTTTGIGNNP